VQAIARLPAREVLYAQLVGTVAAPITGLVRGLNSLIAGLAIQLQAIADQGLVSGEAPAAPAAEPEPEVAAAEPEPEVAAAEPEAEVAAAEPEPEAAAEPEPEAAAEAAPSVPIVDVEAEPGVSEETEQESSPGEEAGA